MGETRKQEIIRNGGIPKDISEMSIEEVIDNANELYKNKGIAHPEFTILIENVLKTDSKSTGDVQSGRACH